LHNLKIIKEAAGFSKESSCVIRAVHQLIRRINFSDTELFAESALNTSGFFRVVTSRKLLTK